MALVCVSVVGAVHSYVYTEPKMRNMLLKQGDGAEDFFLRSKMNDLINKTMFFFLDKPLFSLFHITL